MIVATASIATASIASALVTCRYGISFRNISGRARPFMDASAATTRTIAVLIFIPPATEPEAPPINIKPKNTKSVLGLVSAKSNVLNPDVLCRGSNMMFITWSSVLILANVFGLPSSKAATARIPITHNPSVPNTTKRVSRAHRFGCLRLSNSLMTGKLAAPSNTRMPVVINM